MRAPNMGKILKKTDSQVLLAFSSGGSKFRSLLCRFWLHKTSIAQDSSAHNWDILASYLKCAEEREAHCPSLFMSMSQTFHSLHAIR